MLGLAMASYGSVQFVPHVLREPQRQMMHGLTSKATTMAHVVYTHAYTHVCKHFYADVYTHFRTYGCTHVYIHDYTHMCHYVQAHL